ncbi:uncharacterized protein LOC103312328 isoform X2 [Tribolium castaneum]|uniref:uncharacterized protein LOC103312328 isoform X2 n=1 Tax=Tribolium castaneum TaxID=7070 RepID=UPI00046BF82E|nr:PREDICTED: uncharacterized protein LOC103312328 isoform X2 [Tribolium castaneum]|eukprot:XP_008190915.1 PREDICTED: uncharacterized protein LOC103312328 isoform X2 [Tribolium castaneum]
MSEVEENKAKPSRWYDFFHLRPNSWKSDSHLNQKQVNRCKTHPNDPSIKKENKTQAQLLSKSSDWTDVALEVPEKDEAIHLRNPKLSFIFDNNSSTPTPPPRKHKKGLREKIEAVAKNGLQAFQSKKPVEEPLCVKKTVKHTCPLDDHDCAIHNRNHVHKTNEANKDKKNMENELKQAKRRKNLSVVSLPNYNELKLSVATFDDGDKDKSLNNSLVSLPTESKKLTTTASTGKLETCMTRCRSFGSLLPQQLLEKLKIRKVPIDIESDDSFGGLEDWDLRIIEHYNPKDTSLPRQNGSRTSKDVLSDVESLVVKDIDIEQPKAPARRSESLLKKITREASESAVERRSQVSNCDRGVSPTPPPSPERKEETTHISADKLPTEENGQVEHSSLMKILEEFSIKDKQKQDKRSEEPMNNSLIIPNSDLQKKIDSVEDFLNNEKLYTNRDLQHSKSGNMEMVKT